MQQIVIKGSSPERKTADELTLGSYTIKKMMSDIDILLKATSELVLTSQIPPSDNLQDGARRYCLSVREDTCEWVVCLNLYAKNPEFIVSCCLTDEKGKEVRTVMSYGGAQNEPLAMKDAQFVYGGRGIFIRAVKELLSGIEEDWKPLITASRSFVKVSSNSPFPLPAAAQPA